MNPFTEIQELGLLIDHPEAKNLIRSDQFCWWLVQRLKIHVEQTRGQTTSKVPEWLAKAIEEHSGHILLCFDICMTPDFAKQQAEKVVDAFASCSRPIQYVFFSDLLFVPGIGNVDNGRLNKVVVVLK